MVRKLFAVIICSFLMVSCVTIPRETVSLSEAIGTDLHAYHLAHSNMVKLYYGKIKNDINAFVDNVYVPFVMHAVLKSELKKYQNGEISLYKNILLAGTDSSKVATEEALTMMVEFQEAAYQQISSKRNELLDPILTQEKEVLSSLDLSYQNTINANNTLTAYLLSARKLKETQKEALSTIGLKNADSVVSDKLVKLSESIDSIIGKSKKIDTKSDEAYRQINDSTFASSD